MNIWEFLDKNIWMCFAAWCIFCLALVASTPWVNYKPTYDMESLRRRETSRE